MMKLLADIHRRSFVSGLFAGVAAAGFANSVRAQTPGAVPCHVGPPTHAEGPPVWMDMDQIELDAAYDQAFYAPMGYQIAKRIASTSDAVRARLGEPLRLPYGQSEIEKLDIYRARKPNAPIFLFIHGGAWLGGRARDHAYPAELFINAGANFIVLDYVGIKEAGGDLRVMAGQVRRAIAWIPQPCRVFRRRCQPAVYRRTVIGRSYDGSRARDRLVEGLRRACRHRKGRHLFQRHV